MVIRVCQVGSIILPMFGIGLLSSVASFVIPGRFLLYTRLPSSIHRLSEAAPTVTVALRYSLCRKASPHSLQTSYHMGWKASMVDIQKIDVSFSIATTWSRPASSIEPLPPPMQNPVAVKADQQRRTKKKNLGLA